MDDGYRWIRGCCSLTKFLIGNMREHPSKGVSTRKTITCSVIIYTGILYVAAYELMNPLNCTGIRASTYRTLVSTEYEVIRVVRGLAELENWRDF